MNVPQFMQFGSLAEKAFEVQQKMRHFQWVSQKVKNFQFKQLKGLLSFWKEWLFIYFSPAVQQVFDLDVHI